VHFITASLAKAFAGRAGFFTMPDELRPYLMCHSYPSIFSSCLLPHEIAGLAATLEVVKRSDDARVQLRRNTQRLRQASATAASRSTMAASRSSRWKRARKPTRWPCATSSNSAACSARCSARRPPAAIARWCA
jgi:7-keto-8-aminopelargonate synthetase-like enzyme